MHLRGVLEKVQVRSQHEIPLQDQAQDGARLDHLRIQTAQQRERK